MSSNFSFNFLNVESLVQLQVVQLVPWNVANNFDQVPHVQSFVTKYRGKPVDCVEIYLFDEVTLIGISKGCTIRTTHERELAEVNPRKVVIIGSVNESKKLTTGRLSHCLRYMQQWSPEVIQATGVAFTKKQFFDIMVPGLRELILSNCSIAPMPEFSSIVFLMAHATKLHLNFADYTLTSDNIRMLAEVRNKVNARSYPLTSYDITMHGVAIDVDPEAIVALYPPWSMKNTTISLHFDGYISKATRKGLKKAYDRKCYRLKPWTLLKAIKYLKKRTIQKPRCPLVVYSRYTLLEL